MFIAQSPIRPEMVYQLDRKVGYYRAQKGKGKGKRKRDSPQQAELEEGEIQALAQQRGKNIRGPKNVEAAQAQDDPKVPPTKQVLEEIETEVPEVSLPQQLQASPSMPKKREKINTLVKKRQKVIKKVIHFPSIPEPIVEEVEEQHDEDEEDNLPLYQRTWLAQATEEE